MYHKAEENLRCSRLALQKRLFNASVSRSYYAMLQSSLYILEFVRASPHRYGDEKWEHYRVPQAMAEFASLPEDLRKDFMQIRRRRRIADYLPEKIPGNMARESYMKAKNFMKWVKERSTQR